MISLDKRIEQHYKSTGNQPLMIVASHEEMVELREFVDNFEANKQMSNCIPPQSFSERYGFVDHQMISIYNGIEIYIKTSK